MRNIPQSLNPTLLHAMAVVSKAPHFPAPPALLKISFFSDLSCILYMSTSLLAPGEELPTIITRFLWRLAAYCTAEFPCDAFGNPIFM